MNRHLFLGSPDRWTKAWIEGQPIPPGPTPPEPPEGSKTRIWWSDDENDYDDYLFEGALDVQTMINAGLMHRTDGGDPPWEWNVEPRKVQFGTALTGFSGESIFYGLHNLAAVVFSDTVKATTSFEDCCNLSSVTLGNSMTAIVRYSFADTDISEIGIPSTVEDIGYKAFQNCKKLSAVALPASLTCIGQCGFYGCDALEDITVPADVEEIGRDAFQSCANLTSVYFAGKTLDEVKGIVDENGEKRYPWGLDESVIHPELEPVGQFNFLYKIAGGTDWQEYVPTENDIKIVDNIVAIAATDFKQIEGFDSVREVKLPNKWKNGSEVVDVTSIGNRSFWGCSGLTRVTIPGSVTNIGSWAFRGCRIMTAVEFQGNAPTVGNEAFSGIASGCKALISSAATGFSDPGQTWNGLIVEVMS